MDLTTKISDLFKLLREIPVDKQEQTIKLLEAQTKLLKEASAENGTSSKNQSTQDDSSDTKQDSKRGRPAKTREKPAAAPPPPPAPPVSISHSYNTRKKKRPRFKFDRASSVAAGQQQKRGKTVSEIPDVALKMEPKDESPEWKPSLSVENSPRKPKQATMDNVKVKQEPPDDITEYVDMSPLEENNVSYPPVSDSDDTTLTKHKIRKKSTKAVSGTSKLSKRSINKDIFKDRCTCQVCGRVLASLQAKRQHMLLHSDAAPPFSCDHCDKTFKQQSSWTIHKKKFHRTEKPAYCCTECDFEGVYQHMLTDHMRRFHIKSRDFLCSNCGKGFLSKRMLGRHEEVHMSKDRLACDLCDYHTHSTQCMRTHRKNMHSQVAKSFICEICGCKLKYLESYRGHMRRHAGLKPFKCDHDECEASFASSSQQQTHMRTHMPRTEECDVCKKKFMTRDHLRRHITIHSGAKPFQCPRCSYACNLEFNLRKHCRNRHQIVYPPLRMQYVKRMSEIGYDEELAESNKGNETVDSNKDELKQKDTKKEEMKDAPVLQNCESDNTVANQAQAIETSSMMTYNVLTPPSNGDETLIPVVHQPPPLSSVDKFEDSGVQENVVFQGSKILSHITETTPVEENVVLQGSKVLSHVTKPRKRAVANTNTQEQVKFEVMEMSQAEVANLATGPSSDQVLYIVENDDPLMNNAAAKPSNSVQFQTVEGYVIEDVHHEEVAQIVKAVRQHDTEQKEPSQEYARFILG